MWQDSGMIPGCRRLKLKPDFEDTVSDHHKTIDVLTPEQRRLVMSRIRGKDTRPEILIRRGLHARGLRFRLHKSGIRGKPDMIFPKHRTAVFINGCFWHGHGCSLFKWPRTRVMFWKNKINRNRDRDQETLTALMAEGWRILVIWECALRGRRKRIFENILTSAEKFICKEELFFSEIKEI